MPAATGCDSKWLWAYFAPPFLQMEIHSTSHLHITADMDEETKTKLRREKNR